MQTSSALRKRATNEEAIKDVQDAQSILTQAIQILMDFHAMVHMWSVVDVDGDGTHGDPDFVFGAGAFSNLSSA